jgi:hypothetical protein
LSVNYNLNVENARLQIVANAIDAGGGSAVISSFQLARPCGTVSADVLSFNGLSLIDPAAAGTGPATSARVEDSTGTIVISGLTVGGSTSDIAMSPSNFITAGQTIALTAATNTGN